VPKVQDLNEIERLVDSVINQYWRVNQLPDTWESRDWGADVWKTLQ
jgi:hypothetical protein